MNESIKQLSLFALYLTTTLVFFSVFIYLQHPPKVEQAWILAFGCATGVGFYETGKALFKYLRSLK